MFDSNMPRIPGERLRGFAASLLTAGGVPADEAAEVAAGLVAANLAGHDSHGVIRLRGYLEQFERGEVRAGAALEVIRETAAIAHCDAHLGFGQIQGRRFMQLAIGKARQVGVGCVTVRRCGHIGRLGEFTALAAEAGFAALLTVNDNGVYRAVAPPGGLEPRLSTNPLSIAVPTADEPIVLDLATSVVSGGKVLLHRLAGRDCPEGWLQDATGGATTDPAVLVADPPGALRPLGGEMEYKGFGLAIMLDFLAGGLSGGFCPPPAPGQVECNTVLAVVWNPDLFAGRDHFIEQVERLVDSLRSCPRKEGVERIQLPGDRSRAAQADRSARGIPMAPAHWQELGQTAERLGVPVPALDG